MKVRRTAAVACVLLVTGFTVGGRKGMAQCSNNPPIGMMGNKSATCFGTGSLVSAGSAAIWDVAFGYNALNADTSGFGNTAIGNHASALDTTGYANTAVGSSALSQNTTGNNNTAVGYAAMNLNVGSGNTAVGMESLTDNNGGSYNTAVGMVALGINTTGNDNLALGESALASNMTGSYNVAAGSEALYTNNGGTDNAALGANALYNLTGGNGNLALGVGAGYFYSGNESWNVLVASYGQPGESNVIRIGTPGTHNQAFLAGVYGVASSSGVPVYVNSSGQLGTVPSSLRFKEDVADMGAASDELLKLRPVTFRYKAAYDDGRRTLQYGLIAEEVAAVDPGLVEYGADGQPLTVRYHLVNAMLLGEVQKQHAVVTDQAARLERQEAKIARQESVISNLERTLEALQARLAKLEAAAAARP